MGFFSSLIGGAAGLAGDAIRAGMGASKENKRVNQIQQQLEQYKPLVEQHKMESISMAKQSVYNTKLEIYSQGLEWYADAFINSGYKNDRKLYQQHMKDHSVSMDEILSSVQQQCQTFFLKHRKNENDKNYRAAFEKAKGNLVENIEKKIISKLEHSEYDSLGGRCIDFGDIIYLLYALKVLTNDEEYLTVINSLDEYNQRANCIFITLNEIEYGKFEIQDLHSSEYDPSVVKKMTRDMAMHITDNESGYFEGITKNLNGTLLWGFGFLLWHYADKMPFEKDNFYDAVAVLNSFKGHRSGENIIECILAEIYMKNKLGGEDLIRQNIDEIMKKAEISNPIFARALCSFLAWLGAYNVEYEVLKKAVAAKVQLNSDMQERLNFLAKGGTSNKIKIYDAVDTENDFFFDNSTDSWNVEDFDKLLSKFKMERKRLTYSLVIKSWKKTLPLAKNKKFSSEALDYEFRDMVGDFDNEVTYSTMNAIAVNLDNLRYDDCALFKFNSNRNKGVTILFTCEKFGRNLNLNIITLFTPTDDMSDDDMLKFITAILSNPYVDSFNESILQSVDAAMKEKENMYEERQDAKSYKMFE